MELKVNTIVFILTILWTLPWKGIALWKAARLKDKFWYFVLFLVNSAGLLEIIYIFFLAKKKESANISLDRLK